MSVEIVHLPDGGTHVRCTVHPPGHQTCFCVERLGISLTRIGSAMQAKPGHARGSYGIDQARQAVAHAVVKRQNRGTK